MFRSWPSDPLATRQPSLSGPTRFSAGTRASLKNTSLKSRSSGRRPTRTACAPRPGSVGRDHQRADALVLGGVRVGAHERQQHVGVVRAGGPHLLPVDHEVVAVAHGPGAQRRQVGARARFAHPERRGHLGPQDRHGPLLLLLVGAERDQRRGDDADALRVEALIDPPPRQFLAVHVLLQERRVAATELRWVARASASRCRTSAAASGGPSPGRALLDHDRSSASASGGKFSSRKATNSARKASTSASNVSCTALPNRSAKLEGLLSSTE